MTQQNIFIGYDSREVPAFAVAVGSIKRRLSRNIPIHGLVLKDLQDTGVYRRPTETRYTADGSRILIDALSIREDYDGAISTEFALSRFLVPQLAGGGWAAFFDCDMLFRADLTRLFAMRDPSKAVMVVKHKHVSQHQVKMDGQPQTNYRRKNWSSAMLFNCDHPANRRLTLDAINSLPGRDLHAFCWLADDEIGELPLTWNWLAGESPVIDNPCVIHHTLGSPCLPGYHNAPYANEWRDELMLWGRRP